MYQVLLAFLVLIVVLVALDIGLLSRRPRAVSPLEALASGALWVLAAVGVGLILALSYERNWLGLQQAVGRPMPAHDVWLQYLTSYFVELALSLDNIAVLALIYEHFKVPPEWRNRLLFWTVFSCLTARALLILLGGQLLEHFGWMSWVFSLMLIASTFRVLLLPGEPADFGDRLLVRLVRLLPIATRPVGHHLVAKVDGRWRFTPMVTVVLVATAADLSFAADSIPAAFSVTRNWVIALSANALAILALRSLYFAVAPFLKRQRFLKLSLTAVLLALAAKMIRHSYGTTATALTLGGVVLVMAAGVAASTIKARREAALAGSRARPTPLEDITEAIDLTRKNIRKVLILIAGTVVLLGGVAISPLPGPGFMVLAPIGLAILASEFLWARRLLSQLNSLKTSAERIASRTPIWWAPIVVIGYWGSMWAIASAFPERMERFVWFASVGLFLPIAYWAFRVVNAWRLAQKPTAAPLPGAATPTPDGHGIDQPQ